MATVAPGYWNKIRQPLYRVSINTMSYLSHRIDQSGYSDPQDMPIRVSCKQTCLFCGYLFLILVIYWKYVTIYTTEKGLQKCCVFSDNSWSRLLFSVIPMDFSGGAYCVAVFLAWQNEMYWRKRISTVFPMKYARGFLLFLRRDSDIQNRSEYPLAQYVLLCLYYSNTNRQILLSS